jgi:hypothetical protein
MKANRNSNVWQTANPVRARSALDCDVRGAGRSYGSPSDIRILKPLSPGHMACARIVRTAFSRTQHRVKGSRPSFFALSERERRGRSSQILRPSRHLAEAFRRLDLPRAGHSK